MLHSKSLTPDSKVFSDKWGSLLLLILLLAQVALMLRWDCLSRLHTSAVQWTKGWGIQSKHSVFWRNKTVLIHNVSRRTNAWEPRWNQRNNKWNATRRFIQAFLYANFKKIYSLYRQPHYHWSACMNNINNFVMHISAQGILFETQA